jgi:betaine-aldehyde dehydrogenase
MPEIMTPPSPQPTHPSPIVMSYVDGQYVPSSGPVFVTLNPATGEVIALVETADSAIIEAAVASSERGFREWKAYTGIQRARVLMRAVQLLRERNDELAALEVADTGKPLREAIAVDVASGADAIEYFAGVAPTIHGEAVDLVSAFGYTRREPLGVCLGIGAWNYPIQIACWKSAPALACGNAMIFKPAELTPLSAAKLAEIYTEAGLPNGVFNVVQGDGAVGAALGTHRGIAKVSLTGEVGTGRLVMAQAAQRLMNVTLELGGKSPIVIFDDADLESAVNATMLANFYTQGEICSNGTRVFVQRGIHDRFVARLVEKASALTIGDPTDMETRVGALISSEHTAKVRNYIELGMSENATLACGGAFPDDPELARGNFVPPTVFTGCTDDMRIVREEIFGPVACVLLFDSEEEVVARANDTEFGLAAGVFTNNLARAHRVIHQIDAGTTWINTYNITPIELPFGGSKQSGVGRENSLAAIDHYTQRKSVYVELQPVADPFE